MPDPFLNAREAPRQEGPLHEVSSVEADVQAQEELEQRRATFLEKEEAMVAPVTTSIAGVSSVSARAAPVVVKDETMIRVEQILEEGLGAFYATLPDSAKHTFKQKGEQAATEIAQMVRLLAVKVKRVLRLIRDWLLTVPKTNKFFLEQEAKIKTDKIVELVEAMKEERAKRP